MCFSAPASFIAGTALTAVGVVTLRKTKKKSEIPFAMIPLLFGIQQIVEGFVWLSFAWHATVLNSVMTYIFSLFAFVVWPIYVPFAIGLLETVPWRKKALYVFQFLGLIVGLYLLYSHTVSLVTSEIINKSIVYGNSHFFTYGVMMFYFAATTISCFFSSKKIINVFGVSVFIAAAAAMWTYTFSFVSVWCFFAALMSVIVLLYFIKSKAPISFTEN
jgi:hypothetical protein